MINIELPDEADDETLELEQRPVDRAYEGIRRAILIGTLKPGDHLPEEMLATMTGTSRTPVREALRRLAAEGLATVINRHRFVSKFSYEEVIIVFELRARLESYAAEVAARKITEAELVKLQRLIDEIDDIANDGSDGSLEKFVLLNADFHSAIAAATHSAHLQQLMAPQISLPLAIFKQFVADRAVNIRRSNDQHRDILAALKERNSDWAAAAMSGHILSTRPQPREPKRR
ncbi:MULTISPECIES: GntR family transcriptional regulator [Agrobacterium]|nr:MULTISPECIES: GntR family transcriptional regulator [Agrobacterium]MBN7806762.1 GntR family transcriptional regulator [Agrobacterium rosae]MCM2435180.1 GntR family transcriptional regulator [Agrobacterium rosae]MDX8304064.1 GntR family transcriptional regulator [Agrobacterium rosae]MDX8314182.1 GntR family transcriptional regulator [Agrobacterium rosae]MDX8331085.1 GntR family transcriptional regulator [Agrobacterium rosae]